ncbi:MAG: site-specific integrase [Pseudomonadota bacterium]
MATIIQRGDKWQAKIRRHGYPTKSKTFLKQRDAEAWARIQEAEMDRGVWRDRSSADATTFYALLDRYIKDVVPTKRGKEVETLRIKTLMKDDIAKHKLSSLTPLVLAEWRDSRLSAGCVGATVRRELDIVSAVFNWARRELMIAVENPVSSIRRPPPSQWRDRRLEEGEEEKLMRALEDHPVEGEKKYRVGTRNKWLKPLVQFALETAMRRGEILSLTWDNVDLEKQIIFLPLTKNGSSRTVPLSKRAVEILADIKPTSTMIDDESTGRVFPVSVDSLKKAWERAVARAELTDLRFHDLRHEAASRMAEKLPNVIELASVTGHRDVRMLSRYYHPKAEDLAKKLG